MVIKKLIITFAVLIIFVIGWWLVSPLFIDKKVNEALPSSSEESGEKEMLGEMMEDESTESKMSDEMNQEMNKQFTGQFEDADQKHSVSGKVITVMDGDDIYLRFEDFEATNGPDLHVFLAKPGQKTSEGIHLGELKGNIGDQNYILPVNADLIEYSKVIIWCKSFDVDFGYALLAVK
ncbi:DM13 domain-containing protein [Bacillus taeanensis]|uniref:Electron transporter n=1 Tax=Bacillus taeanensis TaxID=273032 RepID=A0A366XWB6_9BACI|nr:DM13 domain-containing protein [Bacillus taeanensis]RBW70700.1 electron transporter [Bacillus taeanensis]